MSFRKTFRVRWADVDLNGHMRNTAYIEYAIEARLAYLAERGVDAQALAAAGVGPVAQRDELTYRKELRFQEPFTVTVELAGLSEDGSRARFYNEFRRADGALAATVVSEGVWLDLRRRKPTPLPEALNRVLEGMPRTADFEILGGPARADEEASIRALVERLGLTPHPEGGFFRETWRPALSVTHPAVDGDARRAAGTAIEWLMPVGDFSAFHRVRRTDEVYHLYAGGPVELHLIHEDGTYERRLLTTDLASGTPTTTVEAGCWQAFRVAPGGRRAFGGCTVAPGFDYADFELPPAADLIRLFPQHERIIRELTRR